MSALWFIFCSPTWSVRPISALAARGPAVVDGDEVCSSLSVVVVDQDVRR